MSWVRIDDQAWSHPKLADLSGNAVRVWLFALCWANSHETDGDITKGGLRLLGGTAKEAKELVDAGLWVVTEAGWTIHNFLKYQPSKAQRNEQREATAERVKRSRNAKRTPYVTPLHRENITDSNEHVRIAPVPAPSQPNPTQESLPAAGRASELAGRLIEASRPPGHAPTPRKDPLGQRIPLSRWFPSQQWLDWTREIGITPERYDQIMVDVRDKLTGSHDFEWWDSRILRFFEVGAKSGAKRDAQVSAEDAVFAANQSKRSAEVRELMAMEDDL